MKNLFLFLAIFLAIPASSLASGAYQTFSDVSDFHKNYTSIEWAQDMKIVKGYSDGTFQPQKTISRAEFIKMLLVSKYADFALNKSLYAGEIFFDMQEDDWFSSFVIFAQNNNIISGYSDGTFRPHNTINFAEAAKIISLLHFPETVKNSAIGKEWWEQYKNAFVSMKLPTHDANHFVTRAEMTEILYALGNKENLPEKDVQLLELEKTLLQLYHQGGIDFQETYEFEGSEYLESQRVLDQTTLKKIGKENGKNFYVVDIFCYYDFCPGKLIYFYDVNGKTEIVGEKKDFEWVEKEDFQKFIEQYNISFGSILPEKYKMPKEVILQNGATLIEDPRYLWTRHTFLKDFPFFQKTGIIHPSLGELFLEPTSNTFLFKGKDEIFTEYTIEIPFLNANKTANVEWINGVSSSLYDNENQTGYFQYSGRSCYGPIDSSFVVSAKYPITLSDNQKIFINPNTDIQKSGVSKNGEVIYELKNTEHAFLKNMYENKYYPAMNTSKISYQEFIKMHPVIFWQDQFGRWILLQREIFYSAC